MKKYIITGGTGFIGRALVRHLFDTGERVRTLVRPSPRTPRLPTGISLEVGIKRGLFVMGENHGD